MRTGEHNFTLHVEELNRQKFFVGSGLVVVSFFMPWLINVHTFDVWPTLEQALREGELTQLMVAALQLVAMNSMRTIPLYVGAFFIGESITFRWANKNIWWINALFIIGILRLTYWGVEQLHQIRYDFGIPAILVSCMVVIFRKMDYQYIGSGKKTLQIILFLIAFQFLDIMPALCNLPVGRGEISMDIKTAAIIMGGETLLDAMGLLCFILFLVFGILIFYQLREENRLRELDNLREQNQSIRMQNELNEIKNRTYQEMQYLVHDLKSPLTSVQTLVGVIKMESEAEQASERMEYLERIERGIERMNEMISDILYEDRRSEITTEKVLDTALAQISIADYANSVLAENKVPDAKIYVNRILFPRALVNLAQNSARAIPNGRTGYISLKVDRVYQGPKSWIVFSVSDNGSGISRENQRRIWEHGVSDFRSSGLGLAFVRKVVNNAQGHIQIFSTPNEGTNIRIFLPERGDE